MPPIEGHDTVNARLVEEGGELSRHGPFFAIADLVSVTVQASIAVYGTMASKNARTISARISATDRSFHCVW